jgi:hypothetical protein
VWHCTCCIFLTISGNNFVGPACNIDKRSYIRFLAAMTIISKI